MKSSYAVVLVVHSALQEEFSKWMKEDHVRKIANTGLFANITCLPAEDKDADGNITNIFIYRAKTPESLMAYQEKDQPGLKTEFLEKWADPLKDGLIKVIVRVEGEEENLF